MTLRRRVRNGKAMLSKTVRWGYSVQDPECHGDIAPFGAPFVNALTIHDRFDVVLRFQSGKNTKQGRLLATGRADERQTLSRHEICRGDTLTTEASA